MTTKLTLSEENKPTREGKKELSWKAKIYSLVAQVFEEIRQDLQSLNSDAFTFGSQQFVDNSGKNFIYL